MRHLAQASDVQLYIGESILPIAVMDSPMRNCASVGASETSEPGIHNHDGEYGFPDVQLHI